MATPLFQDDATQGAGPFDPQVIDVPVTLETGMEEDELVQLCREWKEEARSGRESGSEPRDEVWSALIDLYNGRDPEAAEKEDWQHREVSREGTKHVDRFSAAAKRALMQPGQWYAIRDFAPGEQPWHDHLRKLIDLQLAGCATTVSGYPTDFRHVFSKLLKMGGCMAIAAAVTKDPYANRIRVDEVDPRELYYDPTGRGLYRLRSRERDKHEFEAMAHMRDADGRPLYFADRLAALGDMRRDRAETERQQTTGHTEGSGATIRRTRVEDEFLFKCLLNRDGDVVGENVLVIMGNEQRIIRGPEKNPFWHGRDWIIYQSMLESFLTIYGRAYLEDFAPAVRTLSRFQSMIIDAGTVSAMPNYGIRQDLLLDPRQIDDGLRPFKLWIISDDAQRAEDFMHRVETGSVGNDVFQIWNGLKAEVREGAMQNQIDLGAFPNKSGITATESNNVKQSGSELVQDVAENIDDGALGPMVELIAWTSVQELDFADPALISQLGAPICSMFATRGQEFAQRQVAFKASAITALAERAVRVQARVQLLSVVGQNPLIAQDFVQKYSVGKMVDDIIRDMGIDASDYERGPEDGPPPVSPDVEARTEMAREAQARHTAGMGTDERRARAAELQTQIAQQEAERAAAESAAGAGEAE